MIEAVVGADLYDDLDQSNAPLDPTRSEFAFVVMPLSPIQHE
jgi:hypothetical protein